MAAIALMRRDVATPITDPASLKSALHALARTLHGDLALIEPNQALVSIPGSRVVSAPPARTVEVVHWDPTRTYDAEKIITKGG